MTESTEIYEEYLGKLKKGIFEVTFTKVNGEERIMNCTLHDKVIPQATKKDPLTQTKVREINENVVSVWDVKAEGWRSFDYNRVLAVEKKCEAAMHMFAEDLASEIRKEIDNEILEKLSEVVNKDEEK